MWAGTPKRTATAPSSKHTNTVVRYDPQTLLPIYNAGSFNLWLHILDDSALDVLLEECLLREELHRALLRSSSSSRDFVVAACRRSMP